MTIPQRGRWWSDLRVRLGGLRLVALPLIALCALTLFMRAFFAERRSADYELYQTIQVHSRVEALQAQLLNAHAVVHDYSEKRYKNVVQSMPNDFNLLRQQFSRDPDQGQRMHRLEPLMKRELQALAETSLHAIAPPSPSLPLQFFIVQADQVSNSIRGILDEIIKVQDRRMQQAYASSEKTQHRGDIILFGTLAFGFLGGLGSVWLLMSKLIASERDRAEKTVQKSQAQLQTMLEKAEAQAQALEQNEEMLSHAKDEAERANRAKSDYLSRMSHELRTPLNAILGFGQLLEMGRLEEKDLENVGHILKAGRHLLSLINEVLDISRIEAGRLSLSLEPVQLQLVLQEALAMVTTQAKSRQIELVSESAQAHLSVHADHQRLKQVLLNLLTNAIKYNRAGGTVSISTEDVGRGQIRISVTDTGNGIAAENLPLLFQPFERLGAEQTEVEGTGIGLVLSKRLVELMGGSIGVESQTGQGTTFWVEFPTTAAQESGLDFSRQLAAAAQAVQAAPPTVLCIEDNPSNLRLIEQIFASLPAVRLISAIQGEEGLKLAREQLPQLIMLDVHLPDMDGRDVLFKLKADPKTASIPVMVVTADATARQEQRMWEAGACCYLTKPLDIQKLLKAVEELLVYEATV